MNEKQNNHQEIDILSLLSSISKKINSVFVLILNLLISGINLFIRLLAIIRKKLSFVISFCNHWEFNGLYIRKEIL